MFLIMTEDVKTYSNMNQKMRPGNKDTWGGGGGMVFNNAYQR